jgi:hypothetical protein
MSDLSTLPYVLDYGLTAAYCLLHYGLSSLILLGLWPGYRIDLVDMLWTCELALAGCTASGLTYVLRGLCYIVI